MSKPPEIARRPRSADVAAASGVSRATVSYVLNNKEGQSIPEETRRRVIAAAESLGYALNPLARALKQGTNKLVLFDLHGYTPGEPLSRFLAALDRELSLQGFALLVHHGLGSSHDLRRVAVQVSAATVISSRQMESNDVEALRRNGIVFADASQGWNGRSEEAVLQLHHLVEKGHRKVAYAASDWATRSFLVDRRWETAGAVAAEQGIELIGPVVFTESVEGNAQNIRRMLSLGATAVAAFNDDVALTVLGAARRVQCAVPERLAVIGIDDIPLSRHSFPALTTIAMVEDVLARTAAAGIAGETPPPIDASTMTLITRETT